MEAITLDVINALLTFRRAVTYLVLPALGSNFDTVPLTRTYYSFTPLDNH